METKATDTIEAATPIVSQEQNQNSEIAKVAVKKVAAKSVKKKPAKKTSTVKKQTKLKTVDNSGRNFGRIKVHGQTLLKGKAVREAISMFVNQKNPTLAELKLAFPDNLQPSYGVVQEIAKARKYNVNGKSRYFTSADLVISTKDGKKVAVCNQWTNETIKPFIKQAKKNGITMTPVVK